MGLALGLLVRVLVGVGRRLVVIGWGLVVLSLWRVADGLPLIVLPLRRVANYLFLRRVTDDLSLARSDGVRLCRHGSPSIFILIQSRL